MGQKFLGHGLVTPLSLVCGNRCDQMPEFNLEFSMMSLQLHPIELTPSGRPLLQTSEVEHYTLDRVDLEFGDGPGSHGGVLGQQGERYKGGYLILTSLRIIWMSSSDASVIVDGQPARGARPPCCSLPLHSIQVGEQLYSPS